MIPIFNVVLISNKDGNAINNSKHVVLFYSSKYSDELYGNNVYQMQIEMSNFFKVPTSLVFAASSEFWFSAYSRLTIYKFIAAVTAFLIVFLIKINNKKLDQIISEEHFWTSLVCIYIIIDNNYKPLEIFHQVDVYLNEPIKIDELIKLANQ